MTPNPWLDRIRYTLVGFMLGCAYYLGAEFLPLHVAALAGLALGTVLAGAWCIARAWAEAPAVEVVEDQNVVRFSARTGRGR